MSVWLQWKLLLKSFPPQMISLKGDVHHSKKNRTAKGYSLPVQGKGKHHASGAVQKKQKYSPHTVVTHVRNSDTRKKVDLQADAGKKKEKMGLGK